MSPISNSYSTKNEYDMKIGDINVSNFHIVLILNEYYTQILAVFDETDAEQKQTCCKSTSR